MRGDLLSSIYAEANSFAADRSCATRYLDAIPEIYASIRLSSKVVWALGMRLNVNLGLADQSCGRRPSYAEKTEDARTSFDSDEVSLLHVCSHCSVTFGGFTPRFPSSVCGLPERQA